MKRVSFNRFLFRVTGLVLGTILVVSAPFMIFGDSYVRGLLAGWAQQKTALVLLAVALLMADAVAPVPATLVIMFLAAQAGWVAGVIGGTVGLAGGVLLAGWFGRKAVGRIAPRFLPDEELARLRDGLQQNLPLTLACWRSVPVMAEVTVILAAATGIPVWRLFRVTLLPNFAIALIYSLAADDSLVTAAVAFCAVAAVSLLLWWLLRKRTKLDEGA